MEQQLEKHKDKIKKLLELSMSDNENEAAIALRQAMSLMSKHNLTADDISGQAIIDKRIYSTYFRLPDWYVRLNAFMGTVSGCFVVYYNGRSSLDRPGYVRIVGRERDVENAVYLIVFLQRALEAHVDKYKAGLKLEGFTIRPSWVKSYRYGFITRIYERIQSTKNQFFSERKQHDLVCVDDSARIKQAKEFFLMENKVTDATSNAQYDASSLMDGQNDANHLQIMSAVNNQSEIKELANLSC